MERLHDSIRDVEHAREAQVAADWREGRVVPGVVDLEQIDPLTDSGNGKRIPPQCPVFQRSSANETVLLSLSVKCPIVSDTKKPEQKCAQMLGQLQEMRLRKNFHEVENEAKKNCL